MKKIYKIVFKDDKINKAVKGTFIEKDGFLTVNTTDGRPIIINKNSVVYINEVRNNDHK